MKPNRPGTGVPSRIAGRPPRGATLVETCAVLALTSAAAAGIVSGLRPLACSLRVATARTALQDALLRARRLAYTREDGFRVETPEGAGWVTLQPPGSRIPLGDAVRLTATPADGDVRFHPTGLADNATLRVACGLSEATVVVNQRGVVR